MKTQEIRVGNTLNYKFWNPEPNNERYSFAYATVVGILKDAVYFKLGGDSRTFKSKELQPIELTESILLAFGCEKTHVYDGLFEYVLNVGKTQIKFFADSDGILADVLGGIDVKTVHHFQNLVFDLTNEDIKLKH